MMFVFADPSQLWLEIPTQIQEKSWQQSQPFSSPSRRWRAYLNRVCLDVFLPWLQEEYAPNAKVFPNVKALESVWEATNGTAITVGEKRLVLIPTEAVDDGELRVPQEWLDIPSWAGDYYLAVQVNPDEQWIRVWGYTTHEKLKQEGCYDARDRVYSLDKDELICDLSVLWVAQQHCPQETTQAAIAPLPTLPKVQAENLIQRLGNPEVTFPHLAVPFKLWGALLENENWRKQFYQKRLGRVSQAAQLGQWFGDLFETGWQSVESVFPESRNLATRFRRAASEAEVERVKLIALDSESEGQTVVLSMGLSETDDDRVRVRLQLHPQRGNDYLPTGVRLVLQSEEGKVLKQVEARSRDNFVQIPSFKCFPGFRFRVQVKLDKVSVTEDFVV
ncbi:DUF1822 family protein [Lusitaniella coriacea LEGE 07157]|uniref:DUF1822 family protein n=1 Tax=Lusitaniella coriacea LEGE 07157 TaxID=945747 RepID=A0A8J7DW32_9CYAN|nr:DUF1822 family protein [Lusitaniella coriacea]MBE9116197.1 DUF1822 family protein [Lusitaniella coriacea LEGE 07157]